MFRGRLHISLAAKTVLAVVLATASMQGQMPSPANIPPPPVMNDEEKRMMHDMERARQKKRAEEMQRDSQRLLQLATELKQEVDKAGENVLSLEAIRKAEEIEKLAHKVKERMRGE